MVIKSNSSEIIRFITKAILLRKLVPDLIVVGKVIADPKVASAFNDTHVAQMLGYLNITSLEVALLLNFKDATLAWKRVVRGNRED